MEMLAGKALFHPRKLDNNVFMFPALIGDGYVSIIALDDLAFYVNWIFNNPDKSAGIDLAVATDDVHWDDLVKTFTEVTVFKAINPKLNLEQCFVPPHPLNSTLPNKLENARPDLIF